jgi:predicted nucleic acid-binding protein
VPDSLAQIILDTTAISIFANAEALEALLGWWPGLLLVPGQAVLEIEAWPQRGASVRQLMDGRVQVADTRGAELRTFVTYTEKLGDGEAAALALAIHRGWTLCSDDKLVRRLAENRRPPVALSGTVGLLKLAIEDGKISREQGVIWLQKMKDCGYYCPIRPEDL